MLIGAIEAGGTKTVCGIANDSGEFMSRISFPTEDPETTMSHIVEYFRYKQIAALGAGFFGPIQVNCASPQYGYITTTPKPGWSNYPVLSVLRQELDVPIGWDTDVNAAAIGEATWGAAKDVGNCVYFTVGTGIGLGVYANGRPLHGLIHPEGGHVIVVRHPEDRFLGSCPYHSECLEGMASGMAIERRWGLKGSDIPPEHPAWAMEAFYIAQAVSNAILMLSPKRVILGGGVMHQMQLFPLIRRQVLNNLNGYVGATEITSAIDSYIVPPGLADNAGLVGSVVLGIRTIQKNPSL